MFCIYSTKNPKKIKTILKSRYLKITKKSLKIKTDPKNS